jgi:hypothetical protein
MLADPVVFETPAAFSVQVYAPDCRQDVFPGLVAVPASKRFCH